MMTGSHFSASEVHPQAGPGPGRPTPGRSGAAGLLHLHGLGHAHPATVIDNAFLESLDLGTDDGWIVSRTGIRTRRTVLPLDYLRDTRNRDPRAAAEAALEDQAALGARAARMALDRAGIPAREVGLVLAGSSAPDTPSPAMACQVARALDLEVPAFDLASACTSFLAQLHVAAHLLPGALPRFALLVVPETITCTVRYDDRRAAVLWGDGAAAAVVSQQEPGRARVDLTAFGSAPSGADLVRIPRAGHFEQQGGAVQRFAIRRTLELLEELVQRGLVRGPTLRFVGHQANLRMLEAVCRGAGIPPEQHLCNVAEFGNTGAAGAPAALSAAWEKLAPGDEVALVAVGAGLSFGRARLRLGLPG